MGNKANKVIRRPRIKIVKELTLRRVIQKKQISQSRLYNASFEHNYTNVSYNLEPGDNVFKFSNESSINFTTETDNKADDSSNVEVDDQLNMEIDSDANVIGSDLKNLEGRRIVDIAYLFAQMRDLHTHGITNCNLSNMEFLNETKLGMKSIFHFKCSRCGIKKSIKSAEESNQSLHINYAVVLASYAIGIGCYQSEEFLANLEIPFMSTSTYDKNQKILQKDLKVCAKKEMHKAMDEEKVIAIRNNSVDINNTPLVSVKGDGCWDKRSYRANYSSKSGTATLIGSQTKKVVWNGVKNKYCKKCANNKIRNVQSDHECNANYHGSPTGMETALLLEAFKESEKLYGVRFNNLVADGDSKVFSAITDAVVYMNPPLKVSKRECCVHLYRCGRSRLYKVKDLLPAKAKEIIHDFQCARKYWAGTDLPFHEKVVKLRENLANIPHHVFGNHEFCDSYFCKKDKHSNDTNQIPEMQKSGQLKDINNATSRLVDNAKSLLYNEDTNVVEQFNSVVNKHAAAKRLNLTTAGSWEGRVDASIIDFNTHRLGSIMLQYKNEVTESQLMSKLIHKLETKRLNLNMNRNVRPRHQKSTYSPDEYYGTDTCSQGDLDDDVVQWRKTNYLRDLQFWQADRVNIERNTIGQSDCDQWVEINSYTVNAAVYGRIANARSDRGYKEIVQNILLDKRFDNLPQVRHDQSHKTDAIKEFESEWDIEVDKCGIFIDTKFEYMTASPDGLIGEDGIIVVSCPLTAQNLTVDEAIRKGIIKYWSITKKPRLKKSPEEHTSKNPPKKTTSKKPPKNPTSTKPSKEPTSKKPPKKPTPTKPPEDPASEKPSSKNQNPSTDDVDVPFQPEIIGFNRKNQIYYQIQGMLHVTQRKYAMFVTWTSKSIKSEKVEKDDVFWTTEIEPEIFQFFESQFLPKIVSVSR